MDIRTPIATNGGDWNSKYGETWKSHLAKLQEKFAGAIEEVRMPIDTPTDVPIVFVKKDQVVEVMRFLKETLEYNFLSDLTATDEEVEPRFEMVYNLFSHTTKARIRIKCRVRDGEEIASLVPLWRGADWAEREVWDMFGVRFKGHPDLRRIVMDERWEGYPLRKDYPLRGYQVFTEPMAPREELLD